MSGKLKAKLTTERDFNDKQRELADLMSDISERCYCAGWLLGNEARLWDALQPGDDLKYGISTIDVAMLGRIRQLSIELDGWIIFFDDVYGCSLDDKDCGLAFIRLSDWRTLRDTVWTKLTNSLKGA